MFDISFDEIVNRLNALDLPPVDMVMGIGGGGIIPAALVAKKLNARLSTIIVQYRDQQNTPMHDEPQLLSDFYVPSGVKSVLLVDDVSVTGKTMDTVRALLEDINVKTQTLVFKGKADYVLLPEVETCVNWPWKKINSA